MVLDTSALIAILLDEPERDTFLRALAAAPTRLVSAATLVEASVVLERRRGDHAGRELDLLVHRADIRIVAVDSDQAEIARRAWRRYGESRHPAALDYGDLFAYSLARATGEPLLFKGDDFAQTDLGANW